MNIREFMETHRIRQRENFITRMLEFDVMIASGKSLDPMSLAVRRDLVERNAMLAQLIRDMLEAIAYKAMEDLEALAKVDLRG
jgi:hypothetical protein